MIEVLSVLSAVLTAVLIPGEHRPPVERNSSRIRHLHECSQPDDGRNGVRRPFAIPALAAVFDYDSLLPQDENQRSP